MKTNNILFFGLVLFVVIVLSPFGVIWAVNTLFNLNIEYSFDTWVAIVFLKYFLAVNVETKK